LDQEVEKFLESEKRIRKFSENRVRKIFKTV